MYASETQAYPATAAEAEFLLLEEAVGAVEAIKVAKIGSLEFPETGATVISPGGLRLSGPIEELSQIDAHRPRNRKRIDRICCRNEFNAAGALWVA